MRLVAHALALALFPGEALAWGLETHLFFAQWVLAAAPFADADLRRAASRLPRLVLAGACLPDLALAGRALGLVCFRRTHEWATLRRIGGAARDDGERALAVGYATHLLSDVVAHNEFVPEHEGRMLRAPHLTHAIAEFAMDEHLRGSLALGVGAALGAERRAVATFVGRVFGCGEAVAARAAGVLAGADRALRASALPALCRRAVGCFYRDPAFRFDAYVSRVKRELCNVELALAGGFIDWVSSDPQGRRGYGAPDERAGQHVAGIVQAEDHA